jgi:hypothetical protein
MSVLSQQEFDEMDGIIVHLLEDNNEPAYAICSGRIVDPDRWRDSMRPRKQCQACLAEFMRRTRTPEKMP